MPLIGMLRPAPRIACAPGWLLTSAESETLFRGRLRRTAGAGHRVTQARRPCVGSSKMAGLTALRHRDVWTPWINSQARETMDASCKCQALGLSSPSLLLLRVGGCYVIKWVEAEKNEDKRRESRTGLARL